MGLTNFNIKIDPFRREEFGIFQQIKNKQYEIEESILSTRKAIKKRCRARCKPGMDVKLRGIYHSDDEEAPRHGVSEKLDEIPEVFCSFYDEACPLMKCTDINEMK